MLTSFMMLACLLMLATLLEDFLVLMMILVTIDHKKTKYYKQKQIGVHLKGHSLESKSSNNSRLKKLHLNLSRINTKNDMELKLDYFYFYKILNDLLRSYCRQRINLLDDLKNDKIQTYSKTVDLSSVNSSDLSQLFNFKLILKFNYQHKNKNLKLIMNLYQKKIISIFSIISTYFVMPDEELKQNFVNFLSDLKNIHPNHFKLDVSQPRFEVLSKALESLQLSLGKASYFVISDPVNKSMSHARYSRAYPRH
ncbi:hypothetical protein BpHYR1_025688 [Brachionus plicatilis]|uniref:Uncharacterized protein n=1 Tax=Brachionus plicatilis TaxID=10195 RepID=A0A3M7SGY4_BRAPC|nr:hypothetical protein BpHYR1_025688 [Brachionus plicatilis]